jgi:hypothetical protein
MIKFRAMTTEAEWKWVWERAYPMWMKDTQGIVAYDDATDEIKAIVVFDSFTPDACNTHFAIDSPIAIRRGLFHEVAHHVFNTCGRKRFFGLLPGNNEKALKLDKHIGMVEVARIPHGYREGVDYIVLGMDRKQCARWLREEHLYEDKKVRAA